MTRSNDDKVNEVGYAFTIRFKYRGERIRSIAEQTMEFLKEKYLELNPTDSVEAHRANDECQVLWDLIGYQRQLIIDASEIEAGEVDWKGVRSSTDPAHPLSALSKEIPFVLDFHEPLDSDSNISSEGDE